MTTTRQARAVVDGVVVAESNDVRVVAGVTYFPRDSVSCGALVESPTTSRSLWKGKASYFHVDTGDDTKLDSAFVYDKPWPLAKRLIDGRVGFAGEVVIEQG